ncbi:UDP-N-acetylmuramyl-tripeptide synthetase [Spirochaetia bacterium]|nr:UDP-N-acetylmuramyl-tripeptide synthetase [Spirochaetia bacterium]
MFLSEFFTAKTAERAGFIERRGKENPCVTGLEYDSRKIQPGNLYFALPGIHADGHAFIAGAISRGALVIVHQADLPLDLPEGPVYIRVRDSRFAMAPLAAAFYGFPAEKLVLAGVTGTEGKSTTVYLIWQLLRLTGKKAGFISTVQYSNGGEAEWNAEHQTTPEAVTIQKRLAEMAANGAEYAVIEASSHGLSPRTNRLGEIFFDAAVLTNVTHEHLEFHGTWEQYRDDKANLFRSLDKRVDQLPELENAAGNETRLRANPFGVINGDDKSAPYFTAATKQPTQSFSTALNGGSPDGKTEQRGKTPALRLRSIESGAGGSRYELYSAGGKIFTVEDKLPGAFNAGNVMAALLTTAGLLGVQVEDLIPLVPSLRPVRGRMTAVNRGQNFEVLVDYAHTPSSFETIFPPLRSRLNKSGGRVISLFGSAGERDTKKRSEQGAIAALYSDVVILTDEDPRGEDSMVILEEIAAGVPDSFCREKNLFLIPSRPAAIRKAFSLARRGDLVLLLGKGHENSIIYKDHTMKYDEIAEAEKALEEINFSLS